jgi:hypothetical protein
MGEMPQTILVEESCAVLIGAQQDLLRLADERCANLRKRIERLSTILDDIEALGGEAAAIVRKRRAASCLCLEGCHTCSIT